MEGSRKAAFGKAMKKMYPLFILLIVLAACTPAAATVQSPAYTQQGAAPQSYGPPQTTRIELAVWSLERAADKAARETDRYGGYVASSEIVLAGERPYARLSLAIPADQYGVLRSALLDLGALQRETRIGAGLAPYGQEPVAAPIGIELYLEPRLTLPTLEAMARSEHRAVRTFAMALDLLAALLAFLFDAAIWLAVLLGPFALLWWLGGGLVRRMRMPVPHGNDDPKL